MRPRGALRGAHDEEQSARGVAIIAVVYGPRARAHLAACLAGAFLAGVWNERGLSRRGGAVLERRPRWLLGVVREVLDAYHRPPLDRPRELARFVDARIEARSWPPSETRPPRIVRHLIPEQAMARRRWPVPEIATTGELAAFLDLPVGELLWLADPRGLERSVDDERLRNYRYGWLVRRSRPPRLIERPKRRLKEIQRRVLHEILDWIPAHPAAHGFTRGRSARSHAAEHTGRRVVLALDCEDFFAQVCAARVFGIFRSAGYPEDVAHTLTALATNAVPAPVLAALRVGGDGFARDLRAAQAHHRLRRRLATPHLPQGAPTSPALANLAAFGLDRRLAGLAASLGATYSRYVDDLTLSGPVTLLRAADDVRGWVAAIAAEEGFAINDRKSVLMTSAGRQRVCAIVVNERTNVTRAEYDELKAIVHNAARHGPAAENRAGVADFRAHLLGRIAWVASLNPARGAKLRARFDQIPWDG